MANIYVRSTDGNNANDGSTWGLAKATLAGAAAIAVAGDTVYVSQAHAETGAGTIAFAIAPSNPIRVLCVNDSAEPPVALATTATVNATTSMTLNGGIYVYGITFESTSASFGSSSNGGIILDECKVLTGTGTTIGNTSSGALLFKNCWFRVTGTGVITVRNGPTRIEGGGILAGHGAGTSVFAVSSLVTIGVPVLSGMDLSNCASTAAIISGNGPVILRNCKLPASWTGQLQLTALTPGGRYEMHNCDDADTNYRLRIQDYSGTVVSETSVIRSGGATDGTTPISWKMVTSANCSRFGQQLASPAIHVWNENTGSAKTITVEVLTDGVTLKDDEAWLEVLYPADASYPLLGCVSDTPSILATVADQAASTETWTTTGLTTPIKQKLSVTVTPLNKGLITAAVRVAKTSTTVYVDPKLVIT